MKTVALLAGARPNYMKVFPVWQEIHRNHPDLRGLIIHTGQHYDELMNDVFFREFGMPSPDHFLGVGSGPHGAQTARVMLALESLFLEQRPDMLVVVGDVNSTMAGALVATKLGIPVIHVEAGLRSGDRTMPEEINRVVTDSISDLLLTSCRDADENLKREGIPPSRIRFVGNVMIDSLVALLPKAAQSSALGSLGLTPQQFITVTLHRPSNVDDPARLRTLWQDLCTLGTRMPVVFPVHPRTKAMIESLELSPPPNGGLLLRPPLGYIDFLSLQSQAALVVTDSGGVQEETTFLGIPCLTLRPNTERPITCKEGTNRLVMPHETDLPGIADQALKQRPPQPPQLEGWDGQTAKRIVRELSTL